MISWLRSGHRYRGRVVQKLRDGRLWCQPEAVRDGKHWLKLRQSMRMYVRPDEVVASRW